MIVAETPRLILRRFRRSDAEPLQAVFGDAEVMHFGDGVQSAHWIRAWLERCIAGYQPAGIGPYAVTLRLNAGFVGYCGLFVCPDINGQPEIEIGYRLARAYWGQGLATEAALAVRDYAFNQLGLTRLIALIDPHNLASIRVAAKLGMIYTADVMLPGYTYPDRVYAVESRDPQSHSNHSQAY